MMIHNNIKGPSNDGYDGQFDGGNQVNRMFRSEAVRLGLWIGEI